MASAVNRWSYIGIDFLYPYIMLGSAIYAWHTNQVYAPYGLVLGTIIAVIGWQRKLYLLDCILLAASCYLWLGLAARCFLHQQYGLMVGFLVLEMSIVLFFLRRFRCLDEF